MFDSPSLASFPLLVRIGLLLALITITFRYTWRGIQNGVLIGLITGITPMTLFRGSELLPGLPIISIDRLVWPLILGIFIVARMRGRTERLPLDWIERSLLAFIAVMLASMIRHGSYLNTDEEWSLFTVVRGYVFPFIAYFVVRRAARSARQFRQFVIALGFFTLYLALTGIAEVFKIHQLVFPQYILNPEMGSHFGNPRGMFLNASIYGLALATALPLLIWLYYNDRPPRRYLWVLVAALSTLPLLYTFQRAAWLSAIIAAGTTALAWPKRRAFLAGSLLFIIVCGFWLASDAVIQRLEARLQNQNTIDYRLIHLERGLAMFQANPLLGVGINRYKLEIEENPRWRLSTLTSHAHNTWVTLLAELGLLGALTFFFPFGFVMFQSLYGYLKSPQDRAMLGILTAITVSFLVMSVSIDLRTSLYSNGLLFTLWAMVLARLRNPVQTPVVVYQKDVTVRMISQASLRRKLSAGSRSRFGV